MKLPIRHASLHSDILYLVMARYRYRLWHRLCLDDLHLVAHFLKQLGLRRAALPPGAQLLLLQISGAIVMQEENMNMRGIRLVQF